MKAAKIKQVKNAMHDNNRIPSNILLLPFNKTFAVDPFFSAM